MATVLENLRKLVDTNKKLKEKAENISNRITQADTAAKAAGAQIKGSSPASGNR